MRFVTRRCGGDSDCAFPACRSVARSFYSRSPPTLPAIAAARWSLPSSEYGSIVAWVPVNKLERLAADPAVRAIEPAARAIKR